MGGDWPQLLQSVFIGLILSFLLAKLISFVTSFKEDNHNLVSNCNHTHKILSQSEPELTLYGDTRFDSIEVASRVSDDNSVLAEKGSVACGDVNFDDLDNDDDWEGVESTELDQAFSSATAFVSGSGSGSDKLSNRVPNDVQFQLYGLYKIATEGPCTAPPPPAFKMTARAKWNAWKKLGVMPPEDAMQKYVDIVTELFPSWASGVGNKTKDGDAEVHISSESKGPIGPVFSSPIHDIELGNELKMSAIHNFAREGDVDNLIKCIESGISVDLRDSEGRTPLHWAVDRGHLSVIEQLISKNADVNVKDNEGQTPLHYAVVCDREAIAEYLVKHNADVHVKDNDSTSPSELCEKNWSCMRSQESGLIKVVE